MAPPSPRTIVILRALQLGDLLCAVPAWRAARAAWPDAHLALVGLSWARTFVERFRHYLDEFIEFPGYPGLPEREPDLAAIPSFLARMQQRRFDLVLQMHGSGQIVNQIAELMGGAATGGFYVPGQYCPNSALFMRYPDGIHEIHRHLRLMKFLGAPAHGEHLEFPLTEADQASLARIEQTQTLEPGRYVCVHPGGRGRDRRWPPERFARIADAVAAKGFPIVITGTSEERALANAMLGSLQGPSVDLVGRTDLGAIGALLAGAKLLIANDTGVSHLAAALSVPSVIVTTGSDPVRWGPLDRRRHRVLMGDSVTTADV
ncbi:MAG TPA: glycosyltransferase family 9 protein, partial [Nitrospiraceae bacterium]|nr:glycosyltransferase family 9 protein [Nitrospiraceae bacterium]